MTVTLPESIQTALKKHWGLNLKRAPLRWVRGDTLPHEDKGSYAFTDTYLVYLTDGNGKLTIGNETHTMKSGCGFKFSEGTTHSVTHTNGTSRLMLGPMSASGISVGAINLIFANPGETVYLEQYVAVPTSPPFLGMQYNKNGGTWFPLTPGTPITIINNNPAGGKVVVRFSSDITVNDPTLRLIVGSPNIQIGFDVLNPDGTRPTITVDGVTGYDGFIENGNVFGDDGHADISVYNLHVAAINGATLVQDGGWVGAQRFGRNALNNSFFYCSSDGPIPDSGGGIVGNMFAFSSEAPASGLIVGCSSSGSIAIFGGGITGATTGGIINENPGSSSTVTIRNCWSTGNMDNNAGGIVGIGAADFGGVCVVEKCYSTGNQVSIGTGPPVSGCGGIFGPGAGYSGTATALYCYSTGDVGQDGGGIFGKNAAENNGTVTAIQCYSTGTVDSANGGGGIVGAYTSVEPQGTVTVNDCYTSGPTLAPTGYIIANDPTEGPSGSNYSEAFNGGSGWNQTNAAVTLGIVVYAYFDLITPFFLRDFGPSPYTLQTINGGGTDLTLSYAQTIVEGNVGNPGILPGFNDYAVLEPEELISNINPTTGAITAPPYDPVKTTYTITVLARGPPEVGYTVTTFELTVTPATPPTPPAPTGVFAPGGKGFDLDTYTDLVGGRLLVLERLQNPNVRFEDFEDYHRYRKAWAVTRN